MPGGGLAKVPLAPVPTAVLASLHTELPISSFIGRIYSFIAAKTFRTSFLALSSFLNLSIHSVTLFFFEFLILLVSLKAFTFDFTFHSVLLSCTILHNHSICSSSLLCMISAAQLFSASDQEDCFVSFTSIGSHAADFVRSSTWAFTHVRPPIQQRQPEECTIHFGFDG